MSHGKGITIAEECHVINATPPIDVGGVAKVSDVWNMANYAHASIIITMGVVGNTTTFTLFEATSSTAGTETAINYDYYAETTAAGDTLGDRTTTAGGTGFASGTNNSTTFVIEIDASELTDGYNWMRIKTDAAAAALVSVVVILSGSRYQQAVTPTAIA